MARLQGATHRLDNVVASHLLSPSRTYAVQEWNDDKRRRGRSSARSSSRDAAWDETDRSRFFVALPLPLRSHASDFFVYLPDAPTSQTRLPACLPTNHRWPRLRVESLPFLPLLGPHLSRRFRHRNRRRCRCRRSRYRYRCRCHCRLAVAVVTAVMLGSLRYRSTRDRLGNTHCPALHRSAPHRTVPYSAVPRRAAPRRAAPHRSVGSSRVVVVVVTAHVAPATRSLHSPRRCDIIDTRCCFLASLAMVSTPGAAILYTDTCFASRTGDVT